jgi:hypothetical protein
LENATEERKLKKKKKTERKFQKILKWSQVDLFE